MDKKNIIIGLLTIIAVTLGYIATQKKSRPIFQKEIRIIKRPIKNPFGSNGTDW
jgi:putative Mn2+ efflux pump MntP